MRRLILVTVLLAIGVVSEAYTLFGHRWALLEVPFYVNVSQMSAQMTPEQAVAELIQAANNWPEQAGIPLHFTFQGLTTRRSGITSLYEPGSRDNVNVIELAPCDDAGNCSGGNVYWWYDNTGFLVEADMFIRDGVYPVLQSGVPCSGGIYLQDFATHEFGHILGLGHSTVDTATMKANFGFCDQVRTLDQDDIDGARSLYGVNPVVVPVVEVCGDGLDNDGDGLIDEDCIPHPCKKKGRFACVDPIVP